MFGKKNLDDGWVNEVVRREHCSSQEEHNGWTVSFIRRCYLKAGVQITLKAAASLTDVDTHLAIAISFL